MTMGLVAFFFSWQLTGSVAVVLGKVRASRDHFFHFFFLAISYVMQVMAY